jgi:hypothetical protein
MVNWTKQMYKWDVSVADVGHSCPTQKDLS